MLELPVTDADHLRSLESFLRNRLPDAPPGYITTLIRKGHAAVTPHRPIDHPLVTGERIRLKGSARTLSLLRKGPDVVDILHEDTDIIVINKPSGIPMHRTGQDEVTVIDRVKTHFRQRGLQILPRPVNRLDRWTSGVVILAKSAKGAAIYGRIVQERGVVKRYLALCHGMVSSTLGIATPIDGRESLTTVHPILTTDHLSLLLVTPHTGRMHQIRIHLSGAGHPIVGDRRYGGERLIGFPGFFLHSLQTLIRMGEQTRSVTAPLPSHFIDLLDHSFPGERQTTLTRLLDIVRSGSSLSAPQ